MSLLYWAAYHDTYTWPNENIKNTILTWSIYNSQSSADILHSEIRSSSPCKSLSIYDFDAHKQGLRSLKDRQAQYHCLFQVDMF